MRVLFVATVVKTHIMQFHLPVMKMLKEEGWEVDVAAKNDYENPADCRIPHCDQYYDIAFARSPFSPQNVQAYRRLKQLLETEHYDVVSCHTPVGGVLGRMACRKLRKSGTRVLYTAHGFHFFKGAPLKNWLLYYPVEWLCAHWTDTLITINQEDYELAQKHMHAKQVVYVPGVGVDVDFFANTRIDRNQKRDEIGVPRGCYLLLSVGELNANKNHQAVIKKMGELKQTGELEAKNVHYAIAGQGELKEQLLRLTETLGVSDRVHLLGYRKDCNELYKAADLYVHPSLREGLPVALMEAKAAGCKLWASDVRGNRDVTDDKGSILKYSLDTVLEQWMRIYQGK